MPLFHPLGVDVVGLQEFENPKIAEYVLQSGSEFVPDPSPDMDQPKKPNVVAWCTSEFNLVEGASEAARLRMSGTQNSSSVVTLVEPHWRSTDTPHQGVTWRAETRSSPGRRA